LLKVVVLPDFDSWCFHFGLCHQGEPQFRSPAVSRPERNYSPGLADAAPTNSPSVLRIEAGHVLCLAVAGDETAPPTRFRVKSDGTVELPLFGSLVAAGKTLQELHSEITSRSYHPREFSLFFCCRDSVYIVSGAVNSPGPKDVESSVTIMQAIEAAGGFKNYSSEHSVKIIRENGTIELVRPKQLNLEKIRVYPADTVVVSRRIW
jgi:polysaccharide biosynthesis/export protein